MSCWLSIVRFVPDPGKGEFVNVAAVAGSDESDEVEIRTVGKWKRAEALDRDNRLPAVMEFVRALEAGNGDDDDDSSSGLSRAEVERLSDDMRNIVQITRPRPVLASSIGEVLRLAFEELIVDEDLRSSSLPYKRKRRPIRAVRDAYRALGVEASRSARVMSGPYTTPFHFVVANGRAVQLVRCFSFERPDQQRLAEEVRSWAWGVRALRQQGGGAAVVKGSIVQLQVPEDVDVEAVVIEPQAAEHSREAFDVAEAAFADSDTNIVLVPAHDAGDVARRAQDRLEHREP